MKHYCRNCYYPLPDHAKFCPHCGQKDSDGKIGMKSMLIKLWNNTFHLEGKFIKTAWELFVPGRVTLEFFKGKQDRYPHPLRLFAIVAFFFLFLLKHNLDNRKPPENDKSERVSITKSEKDSAQLKIGPELFKVGQVVAFCNDANKNYEALPDSLRSPKVRLALDSVLHQTAIAWGVRNPEVFFIEDSSGRKLVLDTVPFNFGLHSVRIATMDMFKYDPDDIVERYHLTSWTDRMVIRQGLKSMHNPDSLISSYIGSLTWTILLLTALMAGILSLLYRRQDRYYVEHFIFLLHFHTGVMLSLVVALLLEWIGLAAFWLAPLVWMLSFGASYKALRRFYGQARGITILKWFIFNTIYIISFIVLFSIGLMVVTAIF